MNGDEEIDIFPDLCMSDEFKRAYRDRIAYFDKSPKVSLIVQAVIETCDFGHKFAKLPDHPKKDGLARCPHCMASGLDALRKEVDSFRTYASSSNFQDWDPDIANGFTQK